MARTGRVTAQSGLNFRRTPGGQIIGVIPFETEVKILEAQEGWLNVRFGDQTGFVSADFIIPAGTTTVSVTGNNNGFRLVGNNAVAPDGTVFARRPSKPKYRKHRFGVFQYGATTISDFVSRNAFMFSGVAPSLLRVMDAVSANEGNLEAINTWDNSFMTFGAFQWTAGAKNGAGELPALLEHLKQESAETFGKHFGQHGLDIVDVKHPGNDVPRGWFSLAGIALKNATQKEKLRTLEWAYRFWLAGHDNVVRKVEVLFAASRIDVFYRSNHMKIGGRFIADYVTSEYGVALLLDQHVNRPGHVSNTLAKAVNKLAADIGSDDPSDWGFEQERRLLELYADFRSRTSMTNSDARAHRTRAAVTAGRASDQRGSFVVDLQN